MKRRKKSVPLMLFWSKREQLRFIEATERFVGLVGDLAIVVEQLKNGTASRRSKTRAAPQSPKPAEIAGENGTHN